MTYIKGEKINTDILCNKSTDLAQQYIVVKKQAMNLIIKRIKTLTI